MKSGKVRGIRRIGIRYAAIALMTTTVLSVGIAGTASATTNTLTAVGSFASASGTGLTTANATLVNADDLLVIWVQAQTETASGHVTGITYSGTGAIGTAAHAIQYLTGSGHPGNEDEIWYAPVTTAGAITLTFTWSTGTSSEFEYSTQEFHPSASSSYSVDVTNFLATTAATTTIAFPTLTPTGAGEVYAGYNSNNSSGSYNSPTTGYTVESGGQADVTGDAVIFAPDATSSPQSPTAVATTNTQTESAIGALLIATADATDTVTFNSEGGSAVSSQSGPDGSTITLPAAPTYAGYAFDGWFAASSGGSALSSPYTLAASTTPLYAQWTPGATDTVTFNSEGGSAVSSQSGPNGSAITLPAAPTYAGYAFDGWFAASSGGSALSSPYTLAASTTPLYAQWTSSGGGGGVGGVAPTISTLNVTASNLSVTSGGAVTPSVAVSGLNTGDTATASGITYTYAGTGSTTYAASATAPSAVGTYSITPSGGTVTVSPSTDQANYAGTYTYVPGTLTITAAVTVTTVTSPPPPHVVFHVARVVGKVVAGRTVVVTIDGTGFYGQPRIISSTGRTTIARVTRDTGKVLTVRVTVKSGTALGTHTFTIILANGKKSVVRFVLR